MAALLLRKEIYDSDSKDFQIYDSNSYGFQG